MKHRHSGVLQQEVQEAVSLCTKLRLVNKVQVWVFSYRCCDQASDGLTRVLLTVATSAFVFLHPAAEKKQSSCSVWVQVMTIM